MNRLINTSIFSAKKTPNRRGTCFGASHIPNPMSLPNRMPFENDVVLVFLWWEPLGTLQPRTLNYF